MIILSKLMKMKKNAMHDYTKSLKNYLESEKGEKLLDLILWALSGRVMGKHSTERISL